jgi:DNA-binding NtrC family response regulator
LRERREDIPLLAAHFLRQAGRRTGRRFTGIEPRSLAALTAHAWPGNIRDLQNTIERAAILSQPPELRVDWPLPEGAVLPATEPARTPQDAAPGHSLEQIERAHIIEVLRRTRGVIEGPRGAASILGLKPSTTRFRMKKLGISKTDIGLS